MGYWARPLPLLLIVLSVGYPSARAANADIPAWMLEAAGTLSAPTTGRPDLHDTVSAMRRWPLGGAGWSFGVGATAERFTFAAAPADRPRRLESATAVLALEYFHDGESVAGVAARPGRYVADHAAGNVWDVPVEAIAAFPLVRNWNGVVGVSYARFCRHSLPVAGVVWEPRTDLRLEAVFPEPALVLQFPRRTLRFGGELVGGGFHRDDTSPGGRGVEYYAYRVGVGFGFVRQGSKFTVTVGAEPLRRFEFGSGRPAVNEHHAAFLSFEVEFRP